MFHAELISLSRGQSYDQVDILEARHGDFERFQVPMPFGIRTVAFYYDTQLIICHPWGVRLIHLDRRPRRGGPKCFNFQRIILDGDISYPDGVYIDDDYFAELGIPDLFEDPGEVIDQVTFSCSQGIFITHDANVVSIINRTQRGDRGITKSVLIADSQEMAKFGVEEGLKHHKIKRRQE
jgi:hypothetical protein